MRFDQLRVKPIEIEEKPKSVVAIEDKLRDYLNNDGDPEKFVSLDELTDILQTHVFSGDLQDHAGDYLTFAEKPPVLEPYSVKVNTFIENKPTIVTVRFVYDASVPNVQHKISDQGKAYLVDAAIVNKEGLLLN